MSKSVKYRSGFSQIIVLIILSVVAISSFVVASKFGNQSQELRSRAQTYTVSPTPFGVSIDCMSDVNPHNFCATANYCPTGFTKISGYCKNSGACCKKDLAPCISTANPNNFCATATYCPEGGFTKILGYCSNGGACCKKDTLLLPKPTLKPTPTPSPIACMSTANPNNFCVTATYCPTGSTKISGYCANSGACCKRNSLPSPTPSPRVCVPPNVCHYGDCSSGYSMVSDKCEGTNIVCCKPKPSSVNCVNSSTPNNICSSGSCNIPGYPTQVIGSCGGIYQVCCQKGPITNRITNLSCTNYSSLIGWSCDPTKVNEIFKGQIACPNGLSKNKGCRIYCNPATKKVTEEYCFWVPDGAITHTTTQINNKKVTWTFCPLLYRNRFTEVINNVISILPRYGMEIICFTGESPGGDARITIYCNPNDLINLKCNPTLVHELMHVWQNHENINNSSIYGADNDVFNRKIGCRDIGGSTAVFDFEDAVSYYGQENCSEALAEAARVYVYPAIPDLKLTFDPASSYKTKRPLQYGFMKGIFGGKEYITSGSQQFNVRTSPILNTNSF